MNLYDFHHRDDWAIRHPGWTAMAEPVTNVFVHHTVGEYMETFDVGQMRRLEESEIARGGYIALAYHMIFPADGSQVESRPANVMGGATIHNNSNSIAVCLPGNYQGPNTPTLAQIDSIGAWLAGCIQLGILTRNPVVRPHSAVFATACPGDSVRFWIPNGINECIERHLTDAANPVPAPAPAPTPGPVDSGRVRCNTCTGKVLRRGNRGACVKVVQNLVHVRNDGIFGPQTEAAVKAFQHSRGLIADGIVGTRTWTAFGLG